MPQENPGLNCPQCNFKIEFSIESLLMGGRITCPNCYLQLKMDVSEGTKNHLQEIQRAQEMVAQAKNTETPLPSAPTPNLDNLKEGITLTPSTDKT